MRLDMALVVTVAAMVFFVLIGQPLLAMLAGLAAILFIGVSGERYKSFGPVEVPGAGPYPGLDVWKDLLKDFAEFTGKLSNQLLGTAIAYDRLKKYVKKNIYKESGGGGLDIMMIGPHAYLLPEEAPKELWKHTTQIALAHQIAALERSRTELLEQYNKLLEIYKSTRDEQTRQMIKDELNKLKENIDKYNEVLDKLRKAFNGSEEKKG